MKENIILYLSNLIQTPNSAKVLGKEHWAWYNFLAIIALVVGAIALLSILLRIFIYRMVKKDQRLEEALRDKLEQLEEAEGKAPGTLDKFMEDSRKPSTYVIPALIMVVGWGIAILLFIL